MSAADEVIEILKDGKTHSLSEIAKRLKLTQKETAAILHFLAGGYFATFDQKNNTAIIDPDLRELLHLEEQNNCHSHHKKNEKG